MKRVASSRRHVVVAWCWCSHQARCALMSTSSSPSGLGELCFALPGHHGWMWGCCSWRCASTRILQMPDFCGISWPLVATGGHCCSRVPSAECSALTGSVIGVTSFHRFPGRRLRYRAVRAGHHLALAVLTQCRCL